ncbi:MAG: hypothetical protein LBU70_07365 [Chitinispirillales bacterium]|jgi:hypothetical protein|nr:hypothetical protein [Chitinispirillales bacterium]
MKAKTFTKLVGAAVVAVVLAVGMAGCGDDGDDVVNHGDNNNTTNDDDPNGNTGVIDLALVTGEGEAWVEPDDRHGYVFLSNGVYMRVQRIDDDDWFYYDVGSWSTSGNQVIFKLDYEDSYALSGNNNTLTVGYGEYTRTPGITNVVICGSGASSSGSRDNRLVNGANEVWADCYYDDYFEEERCRGFILRSNGDFIWFFRILEGWWYGDYDGSWTTQGNNRFINTSSHTRQYSISDNTLTLTGGGFYSINENRVCEWLESDWEYTYTKRSGLTITEHSEGDELYKSRPNPMSRKSTGFPTFRDNR